MESWNPWRELRQRAHIEFALRRLPASTGGAILGRVSDGRTVVLLCSSLSPAERKAALSHELIHDEYGTTCRNDGMPASWDAVVARHEASIDGEVARRLIPRQALVAFIEARMGVEIGVTAAEVAEEFDVPASVAERALRHLAENPEGWQAA